VNERYVALRLSHNSTQGYIHAVNAFDQDIFLLLEESIEPLAILQE
jgi:hypothetical protein